MKLEPLSDQQRKELQGNSGAHVNVRLQMIIKIYVFVHASVLDDLAELPPAIVKRMKKLLERLKEWPNVSGVKKLKGNLAGKHRMRTGDYRLQFRVEEKKSKETKEISIVVEKVGHRDGFYDD